MSKLGKRVVVTINPVDGLIFEGLILAVAGRFWWTTAYKVQAIDSARRAAWYPASRIDFVRETLEEGK